MPRSRELASASLSATIYVLVCVCVCVCVFEQWYQRRVNRQHLRMKDWVGEAVGT